MKFISNWGPNLLRMLGFALTWLLQSKPSWSSALKFTTTWQAPFTFQLPCWLWMVVDVYKDSKNSTSVLPVAGKSVAASFQHAKEAFEAAGASNSPEYRELLMHMNTMNARHGPNSAWKCNKFDIFQKPKGCCLMFFHGIQIFSKARFENSIKFPASTIPFDQAYLHGCLGSAYDDSVHRSKWLERWIFWAWSRYCTRTPLCRAPRLCPGKSEVFVLGVWKNHGEGCQSTWVLIIQHIPVSILSTYVASVILSIVFQWHDVDRCMYWWICINLCGPSPELLDFCPAMDEGQHKPPEVIH